jgi:periplasmic divalent cation tolerance protein
MSEAGLLDPGLVEVRISAPTRAVADQRARTLVAERLAGCVQVIPGLTSTYFWDGEVRTEEELLVLAKTRAATFERICERVGAIHPEDTPEILAVPVTHASAAYAVWLAETLSRPDPSAS